MHHGENSATAHTRYVRLARNGKLTSFFPARFGHLRLFSCSSNLPALFNTCRKRKKESPGFFLIPARRNVHQTNTAGSAEYSISRVFMHSLLISSCKGRMRYLLPPKCALYQCALGEAVPCAERASPSPGLRVPPRWKHACSAR